MSSVWYVVCDLCKQKIENNYFCVIVREKKSNSTDLSASNCIDACQKCAIAIKLSPNGVMESVVNDMQRPSKLELLSMVNNVTLLLKEGLKYHEYDGHNMPKRVARDALEALGIPRDEQP